MDYPKVNGDTSIFDVLVKSTVRYRSLTRLLPDVFCRFIWNITKRWWTRGADQRLSLCERVFASIRTYDLLSAFLSLKPQKWRGLFSRKRLNINDFLPFSPNLTQIFLQHVVICLTNILDHANFYLQPLPPQLHHSAQKYFLLLDGSSSHSVVVHCKPQHCLFGCPASQPSIC